MSREDFRNVAIPESLPITQSEIDEIEAQARQDLIAMGMAPSDEQVAAGRERRYSIRRRSAACYEPPPCEGHVADGPRMLTITACCTVAFIGACIVFGAANVLMFIGGIAVATGSVLVVSRWM